MILKLLLSVLLMILIVYYCIIVPYPLKFYVLRTVRVNLVYRPVAGVVHFDSGAGTVTPTDFENADATLYVAAGNGGYGLLVWFNGGAFLKTDRRSSFGALNELTGILSDYDMVTFDYPTRFRYTVRDSLRRVYRVLRALYRRKDYGAVYAVGFSAGVLLAGAYQNNETAETAPGETTIARIGKPFAGIVSLCGLLAPSFDDPYVDYAFRFYFMRGVPGSRHYTCRNLAGTPKLLVTSNGDYLRAQTLRFAETEPCATRVYESNALPHSFPLMVHFDETRDAIGRVASFITAATTTASPPLTPTPLSF